jgi:predicted dinucleotide-binding enzyme
MTTIGLIGAGNIGSALANLAVQAGYDVVVSNSRGPETLSDLVAELGERARAATPEEAAAAGDLVVVTIPLKNYVDVPVEPLRGKVVIDTGNYYPQRDGQIAELDDESTTTAELVQAHLPESRVVKAFNNINYAALRELPRPAGDPERSTLAIAGDDAEAKAAVGRFIEDIGYDVYDAGPLSEGWRFQRDLPAYAQLYSADPPGTWPPQNHRPVSREFLLEQLGNAKRYRDM